MSGSCVSAWTKSRPSRSWLLASTSSSFAARGVDLNGLVTFVNLVDRFNERVGRGVGWLSLLMVLITFRVAILRYFYAIGRVWLQESYVCLHGLVFMVGAGSALLHNAHVMVDISYRPSSLRYKA